MRKPFDVIILLMLFLAACLIVGSLLQRAISQENEQSPPAEVLRVRAFDGSRWLNYRQGSREYSIRISSIDAVSEAIDGTSCYFHLSNNTFRVDVPFDHLDAMMQQSPSADINKSQNKDQE